MSLETELTALAQAIGADIKDLRAGGTAGQYQAPQSLLCYYGYPIAWRELWNTALVAEEIGKYDHWICGDTYENPTQEVYADTVTIISAVKSMGTKVWGYIPLGMTGKNLTLAQIQTRIENWAAAGATGIFLDEFGFDYANTRQRQIDAVNLVHAAGMNYVANAWVFTDVLVDHIDQMPATWLPGDWRRAQFSTGNPTNLALPRTKNDVLMIENYGVDSAGVKTKWDFLQRLGELVAYNESLATPMATWALAVVKEAAGQVGGYRNVDLTTIAPFPDLQSLTKYLSIASILHKMTAFGLGGYEFGSSGVPVYFQFFQPPADIGKPGPLIENYVVGNHTRMFGAYTFKVATGVAPLTLLNTNADIEGPDLLTTPNWGLGDVGIDWLAEYTTSKL